MTAWVAIAAGAAVAVLALDAGSVVAARRFGFSYGKLWPLSLLAYAVAGFLAAEAAGVWAAGAVAGATAAAVESTVGWRIARRLGVPDHPELTERLEAATATAVTVSGAVLGGLAGLLAA
jgi:hypothetical protein